MRAVAEGDANGREGRRERSRSVMRADVKRDANGRVGWITMVVHLFRPYELVFLSG